MVLCKPASSSEQLTQHQHQVQGIQWSTHSGRIIHFAVPEIKLISAGESGSGVASSPSSDSHSRSVLVSDAAMRTESSARFFILPSSVSTHDHSSRFS